MSSQRYGQTADSYTIDRMIEYTEVHELVNDDSTSAELRGDVRALAAESVGSGIRGIWLQGLPYHGECLNSHIHQILADFITSSN